MDKATLTGAAALLFVFFAAGGSTATAGGLDDKLPSLDGLVRYGCAIKGPIVQVNYADPRGRQEIVWSVTFWAEHKDAFNRNTHKDWKLLYSFRKKRLHGLTDCDKFLERVRKAAKKHPQVSLGQLAAQRD